MKVCPRCFTRFPDGERFCLHDSAILVEEDDIARLGTSIGNYRLDKILGRGGMGTVYSGEHIYIKKPVAVKVLHPQFARYQEAIHRFLREARAATSINHPNIVDVTDFGTTPDGMTYSVMEFVPGITLGAAIRAAAPFGQARAMRITAALDEVLATRGHVRILRALDGLPEGFAVSARDMARRA